MSFPKYIHIILTSIALLLTSCLDENFYNPDDYIIGEGDADMNVTVTFSDLEPALESRAAGNAVSTVESLWVVLYSIDDKEDAVFYKKILASGLNGYNINQSGNSEEPDDVETGSNLGRTGEITPKAKFTLQNIPYGKYKMYVVANVPDLTDDDCLTPDKLKSMTFNWDDDVSKNNAMFGYFTLDTQKKSQGFDAPTIIVNKESLNIHSWIKRLVSKVTVSFDATKLNENVRIYIKSVQIHDIPKTCYLGKNNKPTEDDLFKNGEEFKYYTDATADNSQHEKWGIVLSRGKQYNLQGAVHHTEDDPALYFFENMQGNYPGQKDYLKVQIPDEVGTAIDEYDGANNDFKDRVRAGTYIEVIGYYESKNKDKYSSGPIKYRFMLGKDVTYNYDAERNFHYKLTLKFRGWANEADWHISYREHTPTVMLPSEYTISYLYGQSIDFPVRVVVDNVEHGLVTQYKIKAEIIENNWTPWDRDAAKLPDEFIGADTDINGFAWNKDSYDNEFPQSYHAAGFLSLCPNNSNQIGRDLPYKESKTFLSNYYKEYPAISSNTYYLDGSGQLENNASVEYTTKYNEPDNSVNLKIPMFTRNKEMVPKSDFSGNNFFNSYYRYAKVKFTLLDKDNKKVSFKNSDGEDVDELESTIYQVPRIENPKAIYRSHDNDAEFEIKLMILPKAGTDQYHTFKSDGPWRASIEQGDWFELSKTGQTTVTEKGKYITGSTDDPIEFTYKPSGTIKESETRCGIIKVEYNDYNCVHLIFVRQGYHKGVKLGDANWSCYNVYATSEIGTATSPSNMNKGDDLSVKVLVTNSPLSIGSLFKRCQYNYAILEKNNDSFGWLKTIGSLQTAYLDANGNLIDNRFVNWVDFAGFAWFNSSGTQNRYDYQWAKTWESVSGLSKGKKFTVPTYEQYNSLLVTPGIEFGYGVAYADEATSTAESFTTAYGYTDYDNKGVGSKNGMRVCVVYNINNGDNVLFPVGAIGQGRRAASGASVINRAKPVPFENPGAGTLSYGGVTQPLYITVSSNVNYFRPLTFNHYRNPGAVYWFRKPHLKDDKPDCASWDINYFTIVFNPYDYGSLGGWTGTAYDKNFNADNNTWKIKGSDALPIKLIYAQ